MPHELNPLHSRSSASEPLPSVATNEPYPRPPAAGSLASPRRKSKAPVQSAAPKDGLREIAETIVFVVVLVLMLKSFAAEAFVIPTGSMATTLWGYQKVVACPQCGYTFPINCSEEGEGKTIDKVIGGTCPNCFFYVKFDPFTVSPSTGDRVLVSKYFFDTGVLPPERLNVVVFKYPREPQQNFTQMNYIKRLIGLPGDTIGIHYGKLYVLNPERDPLQYDDSYARPEDLWHEEFMHQNDPRILDIFQEKDSPFTILRKPPAQLLAMRRIVYDNDHPAADLENMPPRWAPMDAANGWTADQTNGFQYQGTGSDQIAWLRYRHLTRHTQSNPEPELITDVLGYNTKRTEDDAKRMGDHSTLPRNWVGDLMLEFDFALDKAEGELILELAKGVDRFRARWDLASGTCTFFRVADGREQELDQKPTHLHKAGAHQIRFANVDERLIVWVDGQLPFGAGIPYPAPSQRGPEQNDLQPAAIGLGQGASARVSHLKLWRDTYYTINPGGDARNADFAAFTGDEYFKWKDEIQQMERQETWSDPSKWAILRNLPAKTLYVQPGHYLCLGDNSPESSDGRSWGLVPRRLLLGRALAVYWPYNRFGPIK